MLTLSSFISVSSVVSELRASGMFEELSLKADENEHSIEMHLPFIAKAMERCD